MGILAAGAGLSALVTASFGLRGLAAAAGAGLAGAVAMLCWPPARTRMAAWAWCVITPHRVRAGCANAWVQTRRGRLPIVLHTVPTAYGERVHLWCRAGITAADLFAARHLLAAACWAKGVWVVPGPRHAHLVTLEVVRKEYSERTGPTPDPWPFTRYVEGDPADDPEDGNTATAWWKPAV